MFPIGDAEVLTDIGSGGKGGLEELTLFIIKVHLL